MGGSDAADGGTIGRGPGRGGEAGRTWPSDGRRERPPHLCRPPGQAWAVATLQTARRSVECRASRRGGRPRPSDNPEKGPPILCRPPGQTWAVATLHTTRRLVEGPGEAARRAAKAQRQSRKRAAHSMPAARTDMSGSSAADGETIGRGRGRGGEAGRPMQND